jgi:hypothetical protein
LEWEKNKEGVLRGTPTNRVRNTRIGVAHYGEKGSIRRVYHKARAQSDMTAPLACVT